LAGVSVGERSAHRASGAEAVVTGSIHPDDWQGRMFRSRNFPDVTADAEHMAIIMRHGSPGIATGSARRKRSRLSQWFA
jgi:hypothetical protein